MTMAKTTKHNVKWEREFNKAMRDDAARDAAKQLLELISDSFTRHPSAANFARLQAAMETYQAAHCAARDYAAKIATLRVGALR